MSSNISDEDVYRYADRLGGQVVIITGAASGIGRAVALTLAKRQAKVVIGDINAKASEELVNIIRINGGTATWKTCNVLDYEDQRALFEFALEEFGSVDAVLANAGIGEVEKIFGKEATLNDQGIPIQPTLKTVWVDYISVIYTVQLATHYFSKASNDKSLKTLVITGSILSFATIGTAPLYCASKYAVLSLAQSMKHEFDASGFRIATVHPWFVDTPIVPERTRTLLRGIPFASMDRVVGAVVLAVTDASPEMNGTAYTIPDEREVFRIPPAEVNEEVYTKLERRTKRAAKPFQTVIDYYQPAKMVLGPSVPHLGLGVGLAFGYSLWKLCSRMLL